MKKTYYLLPSILLAVLVLVSCTKEEDDTPSSSDYYVLDVINGASRPGLTLLDINSYQQTTEYTCGPAAIVTYLGYYNIAADEMVIAEEMGTQPPPYGTNPEQMATWLNTHGFEASWSEYGELDTLTNRLQRGVPTIVEWSDWGGHWVVAIGYDTRQTDDIWDDVIIFADPYDYHDDNEDGFTWFNAGRFYYMWYDARTFAEPVTRAYITAIPENQY